jgi:putative transposase
VTSYETQFFDIDDARTKVAVWVADNNGERPHSSLQYLTPAAYAATLTATGARLRNPADRPLFQPAPSGVENSVAGHRHHRLELRLGSPG